MFFKQSLDGQIDFHGGRTGLEHGRNKLMRLPDDESGLAHQGDFTIRFQIPHGAGAPRLFFVVDAGGLKSAMVVGSFRSNVVNYGLDAIEHLLRCSCSINFVEQPTAFIVV